MLSTTHQVLVNDTSVGFPEGSPRQFNKAATSKLGAHLDPARNHCHLTHIHYNGAMSMVIKKFSAVALLVIITLFQLLQPAPVGAATEQSETASTVYRAVLGTNPFVSVTAEITQANNKPPKIEEYMCTQYRRESYQNYESYQRYEVLYSYWVNGYWYRGWYYSGYYKYVYGWKTYWNWVTRFRDVPYLTTCTRTTIYPIRSWQGAIPLEAVNVKATINGQSAPISRLEKYVSDGVSYQDIKVKGSDIQYGQTSRVKVTYELRGSKPRSTQVTRINPAYVGFCPIGYGRTGGSVTVYIPKNFTMASLTKNWQVGNDAQHSILSQQNSNNMYSTLGCVSGLDLTQAKRTNIQAPSGKTVSIYSWPDDELWGTKIQAYLTANLDSLEEFTGLGLTSEAKELRVAESGFADLSGSFSGLYDPATSLIQLSEQFDEETVIHELTHVWFNDEMPRWLAEGLAQWVSKRVLSGAEGGQFDPLPGNECVLFDPKKVLPKKSVTLDGFTKNGLGVATDLEVLSAQYLLSCGTVATFMDQLTPFERARFLKSVLNFDGESPWGEDVDAATSSTIRKLADAVAIARLDPSVATVDDWLKKIEMGKLVGIQEDPLLVDSDRQSAIVAFRQLAASIREFGWDDLDAPFSIRQSFAEGRYEIVGAIDVAIAAISTPVLFFTTEEVRLSGFREQYRTGFSPEMVLQSIQKSGGQLAQVSRDWWPNKTILHRIGAFLLGDPEYLRDQALVALHEGNAKQLEDSASAAERSAVWSGVAGGVTLLLIIAAGAWVAIQKLQKRPIFPSRLTTMVNRIPRIVGPARRRWDKHLARLVSRAQKVRRTARR